MAAGNATSGNDSQKSLCCALCTEHVLENGLLRRFCLFLHPFLRLYWCHKHFCPDVGALPAHTHTHARTHTHTHTHTHRRSACANTQADVCKIKHTTVCVQNQNYTQNTRACIRAPLTCVTSSYILCHIIIQSKLHTKY